jgi:hypothetical protein
LQFGFILNSLINLKMTIVSSAIDIVMAFQWHIAVAIVSACFVKSYVEYRRLKAFKGPWLATWTDLWFAKAAFGIDQCGVLAEVCEKYGTILRNVAQSMSFNDRLRTHRSNWTKHPSHQLP